MHAHGILSTGNLRVPVEKVQLCSCLCIYSCGFKIKDCILRSVEQTKMIKGKFEFFPFLKVKASENQY